MSDAPAVSWRNGRVVSNYCALCPARAVWTLTLHHGEEPNDARLCGAHYQQAKDILGLFRGLSTSAGLE
jgi:hypothetical protein